MKVKLETLELVRYDSSKHSELLKELDNGISKSKYINSIKDRLKSSSNNEKFSFASAYVIESKNKPIGYTYLSPLSKDVAFIELSILKEYRGLGLGKLSIDEIINYLFENYNIKELRADVDPSNKKSIDMLSSSNFYPDEEQYEKNNYEGKIEFVKDNPNYISKRRKI